MPQPDHWTTTRSHEADDALERTGLRWAGVFGGFIALGIVGSLLGYWLIAPHPFVGGVSPVRQVPGEPVLQDNATASLDIAALRQREDVVLSSSGPSTYHPGAERMPINDAIDQLSQSGLPSHAFKPGSYKLAPSVAETGVAR